MPLSRKERAHTLLLAMLFRLRARRCRLSLSPYDAAYDICLVCRWWCSVCVCVSGGVCVVAGVCVHVECVWEGVCADGGGRCVGGGQCEAGGGVWWCVGRWW